MQESNKSSVYRLVKLEPPMEIIEAGSYVLRKGSDSIFIDLEEDMPPKEVKRRLLEMNAQRKAENREWLKSLTEMTATPPPANVFQIGATEDGEEDVSAQ